MSRKTRGITLSGVRVNVRYTFRPPVLQLGALILITASVAISGQYIFIGVIAGLVVLVLAVNYTAIRLTADETGVRVRNWLVLWQFPWSEITEMKLSKSSRWGQRQRFIEISTERGVHVKALATATGDGGYPPEAIDAVLRRLLVMRREQLGVPDPPELAAALGAAERGDPEPIGNLLASGVIDMATYEQRLHDLADEGRVNLEALRRARRDQLT